MDRILCSRQLRRLHTHIEVCIYTWALPLKFSVCSWCASIELLCFTLFIDWTGEAKNWDFLREIRFGKGAEAAREALDKSLDPDWEIGPVLKLWDKRIFPDE